MKILGIDTCSSVCGVAIVTDGKVTGNYIINMPNFHDEKLMSMMSSLLESSSLKIEDIDGYSVSIGPGSFTGIRIGMSVAKGLALATEKALVGISSLDCFAYAAEINGKAGNSEEICAVIDARRDEVYYALYHKDVELKRVSEYGCKTIPELISGLKEGTLLVGDAVLKIENESKEKNLNYSSGSVNQNDPSITALLGYEKIAQGEAQNIDKLEPLYIKDFKPVTKNKGEI